MDFNKDKVNGRRRRKCQRQSCGVEKNQKKIRWEKVGEKRGGAEKVW